jgi:transmembrane sensor
MMKKSIPPADLLRRYITNTCTEEERRAVDTWYQQLDREEAIPYAFDEQALQSRIRASIEEQTQDGGRQPVPLRRWWLLAGSVAASILMVLGLVYLLKSEKPAGTQVAGTLSWVEYTNFKKKIELYTLPDQSKVWLHPQARLSYSPSLATDTLREVRFSGEGFFDVARDTLHPFVLYSGKLKTQVLGTSFNVKAYENEAVYHVSVVTGSVAVSTPASEKMETLVLKPNQQVAYTSSTSSLSLTTLDEKQVKKETWQPVSLVFDDAPLVEVVARLQKTFRVRISLSNEALERCRLKVDFNRQRLPEILEMISTLLGTTYEMEGENIRISGDGCAL